MGGGSASTSLQRAGDAAPPEKASVSRERLRREGRVSFSAFPAPPPSLPTSCPPLLLLHSPSTLHSPPPALRSSTLHSHSTPPAPHSLGTDLTNETMLAPRLMQRATPPRPFPFLPFAKRVHEERLVGRRDRESGLENPRCSRRSRPGRTFLRLPKTNVEEFKTSLNTFSFSSSVFSQRLSCRCANYLTPSDSAPPVLLLLPSAALLGKHAE